MTSYLSPYPLGCVKLCCLSSHPQHCVEDGPCPLLGSVPLYVYPCCMIAEVAEFPVVLGVEELTGIRAIVDNLCDIAAKALAKKSVDPKAISVVCTDNLALMVAFYRKRKNMYPWILVSNQLWFIFSELML